MGSRSKRCAPLLKRTPEYRWTSSLTLLLDVCLGWGAFAKSFEEGAQWLERIMELIAKKDLSMFALVEEIYSERFWLSHLWNAVNRLRGCNEIDRKFAMQLLYAL